jgi:hypothetical protein
MMVRMTEEQHKSVRVKAAELGRPVSEIVRKLLDLWVEGKIDLSESEEDEPES